jgi:dihydroxyacetone kinase-like protein
VVFDHAAHRNRAKLNRLDRAVGDGDHGDNLVAGLDAAQAQLNAGRPTAVAGVQHGTCLALARHMGGASGALFASFYLRAAATAGGAVGLDAHGLGRALAAGTLAVMERGHAQVGDKTMVDALVAGEQAYLAAMAGIGQGGRAEGDSAGHDATMNDDAVLVAALAAAAKGAREGAVATVPVVARHGRAGFLGGRTKGHMDPGAASVALMLRALAAAAPKPKGAQP